jgi:hypothetical protein
VLLRTQLRTRGGPALAPGDPLCIANVAGAFVEAAVPMVVFRRERCCQRRRTEGLVDAGEPGRRCQLHAMTFGSMHRFR